MERIKTSEEILNDYSKEVGLIDFKNAVKHVWLKQWSCTALIRLVRKAMEEYATLKVKEAQSTAKIEEPTPLKGELIKFAMHYNDFIEPHGRAILERIVDKYLNSKEK